MLFIIVGILILGVLYGLYFKFKNAAHNAVDSHLTKKDEALAKEEVALKAKLDELKKIQVEATNMTPEEIENFWSKK